MSWPKEEPWTDDGEIKARGLCELVVHRILSNAHALKTSVIMAQINTQEMHPDRQIAIQQERSDAFYNTYSRGLIQALHQDQTVTI